MRLKDLPWFVSGVAGDGLEIGMDQPGAAYDQIHSVVEHVVPLPADRRGRALLVAAVLAAKHWHAGPPSPAGPARQFVGNLTAGSLNEILKRVIQYAGTGLAPRIATVAGPPREPLASRIDALTRKIAPWMGQKAD